MATLFVSDLADQDIDMIFETIRQLQGVAAVEVFDEGLRSLYRQLTDFPLSAPTRFTLGPNVRLGIVSPYVVIYRYDASYDTVNVLRVVHGRREIKPYLLAP